VVVVEGGGCVVAGGVVVVIVVVAEVLLEVVEVTSPKSLLAQVSGILPSVAYGYSQCKSANSGGHDVNSSYVTVRLSHLSE